VRFAAIDLPDTPAKPIMIFIPAECDARRVAHPFGGAVAITPAWFYRYAILSRQVRNTKVSGYSSAIPNLWSRTISGSGFVIRPQMRQSSLAEWMRTADDLPSSAGARETKGL
jgi:hypothetical protein